MRSARSARATTAATTTEKQTRARTRIGSRKRRIVLRMSTPFVLQDESRTTAKSDKLALAKVRTRPLSRRTAVDSGAATRDAQVRLLHSSLVPRQRSPADD